MDVARECDWLGSDLTAAPAVTSQGLPIGVQLTAPDEAILLQLAAQPEVADLPPLWQVFGGTPSGPTATGRSPNSRDEVASPDAALHIGPQFVILETAALDAAAGVAGTDQLQGVSSHVMFLARGKVGPFRVEGEPLVGADGAVGRAHASCTTRVPTTA